MHDKQVKKDKEPGEQELAGTGRLAELVDEKRQALQDLLELSRLQAGVIEQGEVTRLLAVLSAKQRLLGRLQQIERCLDPYRDQDPDSRSWESAVQRERCRRTAGQCQTLLNQIMLLERQCESALTRRRDQVATQLQGAHTAARARSAYGTQTGDPATSQLDLTCEQ